MASAQQAYVTRKEVEEIVDASSQRVIDELSGIIQSFAAQVDERFNRLEARVDRLEKQFERLQDTLDHFLKRLDDIKADNAARDAQIARLERWIEAVAKQTGVKLEY